MLYESVKKDCEKMRTIIFSQSFLGWRNNYMDSKLSAGYCFAGVTSKSYMEKLLSVSCRWDSMTSR